MPAIVLSGFDPFQGATVNPSWEVARELDGQRVAGATIHAVRLPCTFAHRARLLLDAVAQHAPVLVLAIGQAAGRPDLSFERVGINVMDAAIADNAGQCPLDEPVVADGPAACFSTLPLRAMVAAARRAGVPASISNTAGTYVCNQVLYLLQRALAGQGGVRSGFLHVPLLPGQAVDAPGQPAQPSMALALQCQGVLAALAAALAETTP